MNVFCTLEFFHFYLQIFSDSEGMNIETLEGDIIFHP
jgi:hypothetical protein